jgi:hypothetical protein
MASGMPNMLQWTWLHGRRNLQLAIDLSAYDDIPQEAAMACLVLAT